MKLPLGQFMRLTATPGAPALVRSCSVAVRHFSTPVTQIQALRGGNIRTVFPSILTFPQHHAYPCMRMYLSSSSIHDDKEDKRDNRHQDFFFYQPGDLDMPIKRKEEVSKRLVEQTTQGEEVVPSQSTHGDGIDLDVVGGAAQLRERMSDWKMFHHENKVKDSLPGTQYVDTEAQEGTASTLYFSLLGNVLISAAKFYAYGRTGSSAMFAEAVHTIVDVMNQVVLAKGLREAQRSPDDFYQYGYGRAAFFYSLLTALSTFGFGALYTFYHGVHGLMHPGLELESLPETWAVLGVSFVVDGFVLRKALKQTKEQAAETGLTPLQWLMAFKDPFTVAVVFEDSAAVLGVVFAVVGLGLTAITGNHIWDSIASICISGLLGTVSWKLIQLNHSFLLGKPLDSDISNGIRKMLLKRPSIDAVFKVQSQWVGPSSFSFKAEVDFDGTYLAAKVYENYKDLLLSSKGNNTLEDDLNWILPCLAEDITRVLEKEVRDIQTLVRSVYKEAAFVEIIPDSSQSAKSALDAMVGVTRRSEVEQLVALLASATPHDNQHQHLFKLGGHYLAMGLHEKAVSPLESCLEQRLELFDSDSIELARVKGRLGIVLYNLKRYSEADRLVSEALSTFLDSSEGMSKPNEVAALHEACGLINERLGYKQRALTNLEAALRICDAKPELDSTTVLNAIARLMSKMPMMRSQEIVHLAKYRIALAEQGKENTIQMANTHLRMAKSLEALGRPDEAEKEYKICLQLKRKIIGPVSLEAAECLEHLGLLYKGSLNSLPDAYDAFEEAWEIRTNHLAKTDRRVTRVLDHLLQLSHRLNKPVPKHWI